MESGALSQKIRAMHSRPLFYPGLESWNPMPCMMMECLQSADISAIRTVRVMRDQGCTTLGPLQVSSDPRPIVSTNIGPEIDELVVKKQNNVSHYINKKPREISISEHQYFFSCI